MPGTKLTVYVDNSQGLFTANEITRIQDAVHTIDAVVEHYGVSIKETSDRAEANIVIDTSSTSGAGSLAQ